MKVYGKRNQFLRVFDSFRPNPYRDEVVFPHFQIKSYNPKIKKWRIAVASFSLIGLLPGIPGCLLIPFAIRWMLK